MSDIGIVFSHKQTVSDALFTSTSTLVRQITARKNSPTMADRSFVIDRIATSNEEKTALQFAFYNTLLFVLVRHEARSGRRS